MLAQFASRMTVADGNGSHFWTSASLVIAAVVLWAMLGSGAHAAVVASSTERVATCGSGKIAGCRASATVASMSLPSTDAEFVNGFRAWNQSLPADQRWKLVHGGALPGGAIEIVEFGAYASDKLGGLEIDLRWDYAGKDKRDYQWAQSIYLNYVPPLTDLVDPYRTMDVGSGAAQSIPLYPFQYGDRSFYDFPKGPWAEGFFVARAFLTSVDEGARILTAYDGGVGYGFDLAAVPVPAGVVLFGTALAGLALVRARRRTVAAAA